MKLGLIKKKARIIVDLRIIMSLFLVLVILQGCSATSSSGSIEKSDATATTKGVPTVLNYGYIGVSKKNLPTGAVGWGLHTGIIQKELKKNGITKINLTAFPNGPDLNESLISGRLNFGSLGDTPAILAKSSGADTRLISQSTKHLVGYLIGKKNGPKTIKDLKGKTIAIQKGSFMHRYIIGLFQKEGITDYKLVHMLSADGEAALARGEVDAITNNGVNALKLIDQGFVHLDDASSHPDLYGSSVTVVSREYLKQFPEFPEIWNNAVKKSLEDLKKHEKEYYALVAEIQQTTPELVKKTAPIDWLEEDAFTDEGLNLLNGTKEFLIQEKLAPKDFDLNEWITK